MITPMFHAQRDTSCTLTILQWSLVSEACLWFHVANDYCLWSARAPIRLVLTTSSRSPSRSTEINRPASWKAVLAIMASGKLLDFFIRTPCCYFYILTTTYRVIQWTMSQEISPLQGIFCINLEMRYFQTLRRIF